MKKLFGRKKREKAAEENSEDLFRSIKEAKDKAEAPEETPEEIEKNRREEKKKIEDSVEQILTRRDKAVAFCNRFSVPVQFLGCCVLYFIMEMLSRHSFLQAWQFMTGRPLVFLYNALLIFTTTTVCYLFRRRTLVRFIVMIIWFLLGVTNSIILANRVTPFTGQDLGLLSDARKVMANYIAPPVFILIVCLLAALVVFTVWVGIKGPRFKGKRNIALDILIIVISAGLLMGSTIVGIQKRVLSNYFSNIAASYENYGLPYCFAVTLLDTGISKPNGYSEQLIHYIDREDKDYLEEVRKKDAEEGVKRVRPNVIFLQLESFFDPETVRFLNISKDPIPYFHELQREYSSGYLQVPVVGAGTANTEFEAITGMSLRYFGAGEYPYKTILKESTCESIPYDLKKIGYSTHAIHNNEANFYGRRSVYPNLGFDSFTSEEYMRDISDVTETSWVKDHILTTEIMKCLSSTAGKDYIYTVSVQGHGDYPTDDVVADKEITVTGAENHTKNNFSWEYYCEQISQMDDFVHQLTDYLRQYDEPVILVMYGDHLPTMGLKESDLTNWSLYSTPYVIWDNYGLTKKDGNYASYQIGAEALSRGGIHTGTLPLYHQTRMQTDYYQEDLELLQYDMLYGKKYIFDGESPFQRTKMRMGAEPVTITGMKAMGEGNYYVFGTNFTASSKVEVDKVMIEDTVYVNQNTLILPKQEEPLRTNTIIAVAQQSNSSTKKMLTRTTRYYMRALIE